MDATRRILEADVLVDDGHIAELPSTRRTADVVIDGTDCLVIPGLIQTHVHLCQTLFRGMADDMDVVDWLRLRIWPFEQAHDPDSIYDSARLAIGEMLKSGTTCALTMETVHHTESALQAILDMGFRATSGKAMMDRQEVGTEMIGEETDQSLEETLRLLDNFHDRDGGRLRYALCPRGSRNCSEQVWHQVSRWSEERGALIHTHAAENQAQTKRLTSEGGSDIAYLDGLGAIGPRTVLAHCVWVDQNEMRILRQRGAAVAHCPSANLKLASGFAPIPEMISRGITVGLGADGAPCNNNLDLFHEMRLASLIHKPRAGPDQMNAHTVFEMATIGGARSLGLENEIGSLVPGKRADMVLVRRDRLHAQPSVGVDPITQLVYEHTAADVDTVIVDGEIMIQGGLLTRVEESEILRRANDSAQRVVDRAGTP